jgi:hypothetical protein
MTPSKLSVAGLAAVFLAAGCAADPATTGAGPGPGLDPDVAGVSLSLTVAQPDAVCLRATFTGATQFTQLITPVAGSTAPVVLAGLPVGQFSLLVEAFNLACASVVPATPLSWTSDPVTVALSSGVITNAMVTLKRPAKSVVTVDYDTSQLFSAPPPGVSGLTDMAVFGNSLYIARTDLERMPLAGGAFDSTWPGLMASRFVVDSSGIFYNTIAGSAPGAFWVPPGQAQVLLSSTRSSNIMVAIPGGYVEVLVANNMVSNTGTIERVNTAGVVTTLLTGFSNGAINLPIIATDGTTVFYAFPTGIPAGGGAGDQTVVGKVPVAGGANNTLATFGSPTFANDIATDGSFVYVAEKSTNPALNGIFRIPAAGGAAVQIAPVAAGVPVKVLVDATNVYFMTRVLDNRGLCDMGFISKAPKAGGAVTPLWSRSKTCSALFAQGPTQLFFDIGSNVHVIGK